MKRTFFIVVLAIFFTFDIFFAISTAVADNLKSSSDVEIVQPMNDTGVIAKDIIHNNNQTEAGISTHN
ncbi:MAG: hypothetical protein SWZ49_22725 [Cyanobacteriota bacterium]|nr:hypothetical protein [Cyanobacteriota bacterium]